MKKILVFIAASIAALTISSCSKFEAGGTATESLAGTWCCSIYYSDGANWVEYYNGDYSTYNTAANKATEMWIDDAETFWGTKCKIDCNASAMTFGKDNVEYDELYNDVKQKIYGGKVTTGGAIAPGSESKVDKIEFYIKFSDDSLDGKTISAYCTTYYVVGYRYTGFPEDDDEYQWDWDLPAVPAE